jgi:hypothetical protein
LVSLFRPETLTQKSFLLPETGKRHARRDTF